MAILLFLLLDLALYLPLKALAGAGHVEVFLPLLRILCAIGAGAAAVFHFVTREGHSWKWVFLDAKEGLRSGWRVMLFFLAYVIAWTFLLLPMGIVALALKAERPLATMTLEALAPALAALLVSLAFLSLEHRSLASIGFRMDRAWTRNLVFGVLFGLLLMGATAFAIRGLGGFHWTFNEQGSFVSLALGFLLFLVVAVHEETVFRGYPFQRLLDSLGPWPTQILLALVFTIVHWGNPGIRDASFALKAWTTLNIALAAVLLGLCYLKTRSLALPIGVHLGWNWAQGHLLGFQVSGTSGVEGFWKPVLANKPQWLTGGPVGLEGSALCSVLVLLAILALMLWKPKQPAPA
jgi:membrane protease YdiL (CAAX protease family)